SESALPSARFGTEPNGKMPDERSSDTGIGTRIFYDGHQRTRNPLAAATRPTTAKTIPKYQYLRLSVSNVMEVTTSAISRNTSPKSKRSARRLASLTSASSPRASL